MSELNVAGPFLLLNHLFNGALVGWVLLGCWSLGGRLLRWLAPNGREPEARGLMAIALGLGSVAYGVFALGLLGLFRGPILTAATIALGATALPDLPQALPLLWNRVRTASMRFARLTGQDRLLLLLAAPSFAIALPIALAPPTDYDGLMYHLAAPVKFLEAGRLYPMPELTQANFPFTAEMIYSLGLAFGSDVFGRLLNLPLWGLTTLGTYWIGRRLWGRQVGFVAALVFLTVPGAYLASSSCVELLWTLFGLAALLAFLRYLDEGDSRWVLLMGIFSGLVLGTKELAAAVPLGLGLGLAIQLLFRSRSGLLPALRMLTVFSAVTLAVASPWYLKNWLWLGSPFYPLFTGADAWARYHYLSIAGTPKTLSGFLALPLALFFPPNEWTFSVGLPSYFFISYLFLALPAVLMVRRDHRANYLLLFAAVSLAIWAAGNQLLRLLYPAYPLFSLIAGYLLVEANWRGHRLPLRWTNRLLALFLSVSLALQLVLLIGVQPLRVAAGLESPTTFLATSKAVWIYPGVKWVNQHLPEEAKLYMIGSGQGYYFRREALPDSMVANMERLFSGGATPEDAARRLRDAGFTHLFLSDSDMRWHLSYRDPDGRLRQQMRELDDLLRGYATLLYQDETVRVYQVEAPK